MTLRKRQAEGRGQCSSMRTGGGPTRSLSDSAASLAGWLASLPAHLRTWRARQRISPGWTAAVAGLAAIVALPLATIVVLALTAPDNAWPHLMRTVLPGALRDTALLMFGVGVLCLAFGTGTAWLITMYRFPGRAILDRLLVLPLAMPTYISAYCYVELLDFSGPVQRLLRAIFGWHTVRDYWFPEIRTLPGAILVLSAVLYPYVYLSARASFVQQSVCVLEVARTLGRTAAQTFWAVALPLARPALAAGAALALMECLNDLGAVQYLGVQTLTVSVYTTWLQRSSLGGAAQIALVALLFVLALIVAERAARGGSRFHHTTGRYRSIPFSDLEGWRRYAATAFCCLPVLAGFVAPFAVLLVQATAHVSDALAVGFWRAVRNSVSISVVAAAVTRADRPAAGLRAAPGARRLRARGGAGGEPWLRTAGHRPGHRPAHSARRLRQQCRCIGAQRARRVHRPAAVGQPVRDRAGLRHPLSRRVDRCAGCRLRAPVAQPRRGRSHAGRDARCRRSGACTCRCCCRRSAPPGCWCSSMP